MAKSYSGRVPRRISDELKDDRYNYIDKELESEKRSTSYSTEKINQILDLINHGEKADMMPFFHGKTEWRNSDIAFEYTPEEWAELQRIVEDPVYFVEQYCTFLTDKGRRTVKLRPYQKDVIHMICDEVYDADKDILKPKCRRVCLLQSRQTGKTTTTSAACVHYVVTHTDRNILVVANKGLTSEEILGKIIDIFKGLPYFLKPGVRSVSKNLITFENGCSIKCSATTTSAGVGSSILKLIVDEAAIIPDSLMRPFYLSIFPTLSASDLSLIVMMSTPRGKHGVFAETYFGSLAGTNGFVSKRVHWSEIPERDDAWKAEQIAAFGEANFNQEFDLSFDSDASKLISPFDLKFAERIKKIYQPVEIYGIPWSVAQKIYWHPDFHPDRLTEQELLTSRFLLKIDTAEGKMKGQKGQEDPDWNIINIFQIEFLSPARIKKNRLGYKQVTLKDCIRFRLVGIYMDLDHDEEHSAEAAKYIVFNMLHNGQASSQGLEIDNVRISLEINFNGVNWIKEFSKHDFFYSSLILKTFHSQKATKKEFGFKTVSGARGKGYWCEEGAKLISRRQIIVNQDHSIANCSTIQQLQSFGKTKSGSYDGDGMHDDIATTVLFCSIDFDNEDFIMWIEDWFRILPDLNLLPEQRAQLVTVGKLLDMYVETYDDEYTEEDIARLYGNSASGFGLITTPSGNFNAPRSGNFISNPYTNTTRFGGNNFNNPYLQRNGSMYQQMNSVMMPRHR